MFDSTKNYKVRMITLIGMAVMIIDAILFAVLYRRTGNCLISFIPHFLNNMIGFFLVPVMFG